jgi:hypothetical protein
VFFWLVVPIAGVFAAAAVTDIAYNVRYACAALPAYIFILAAAIGAMKHKAVQLSLLTAVVLANSFSLTNYYFDTRYAREDSRAAARYLESAAGTKDAVLLVGSTGGLRYYYKGQNQLVRAVVGESAPQTGVDGHVDELIKDSDRVWLVQIRPWETDPQGKVKAALDNLASADEHKTYAGVEIHSYQLPDRRP